ncbi:MAG: hypothetical protein A2Y95_10450 [Deltaproteobacteria bacterium RBG_13_65_10]|nr:MAG: hypothetical protein A2Y95_10450 [Deltaproteobacteria bacterium RBG_13_65_10]
MPGDQKSILLVDDVRVFLELECMFLQRKGFNIFTARTGQEAMERVREHRPDVVLLDLILPDMGGDECCRQIKQDPTLSNALVIIVTTSDRDEDRARCIEVGCDGYLTKPLKQTDLLSKIKSILPFKVRTDPRLPISLPVRYGTQEVLDRTSVTLNISSTGMFIVTPKLLSTGAKLSVEFTLPEGVAPAMRTPAEVVWNTQGMPKGALTPGFGIRFNDLDEDKKALLRKFVDDRLR